MEPARRSGHLLVVSMDGTDRELWTLVLEGRDAAFGEIYDRYSQRLLTYAHRRTGSAVRAEDVVSLVMLETWRRRDSVRFGADDSIAGWLFRTAQFVLANELRALRRHRRALDRIGRLAPEISGEVDRRLLSDERLRVALRVVEQLPPRDREVLALAAWSGLSEVDMATALGIPVGTFKSRLSRARRLLAARCDSRDHSLTAIGPIATTLEGLS
jgi:RNA polymerase sigma factor (sigma-70 family)